LASKNLIIFTKGTLGYVNQNFEGYEFKVNQCYNELSLYVEKGEKKLVSFFSSKRKLYKKIIYLV